MTIEELFAKTLLCFKMYPLVDDKPYDFMLAFWTYMKDNMDPETLAKNLNQEIKFRIHYFNLQLKLKKDLANLNNDSFKWFFITIGYDDENITVDKIRKYSARVATSNYFIDCEYVNEKFRKNDKGEIYIHHHTHFLVKCDLPKSRVIDRIFATVKDVVKSKNFIDIKSPKDHCGTYDDKLRYVRGDKREEKMECVRLDRNWRIDNNL